jgi:hypothetical protein
VGEKKGLQLVQVLQVRGAEVKWQVGRGGMTAEGVGFLSEFRLAKKKPKTMEESEVPRWGLEMRPSAKRKGGDEDELLMVVVDFSGSGKGGTRDGILVVGKNRWNVCVGCQRGGLTQKQRQG